MKEQWFDQMLTATTDLFFDLEMPLFFHSLEADDVRTVLDVGTGNGEYLARLSRLYPGIRFRGLEMDERIFRYAQAKETENLSFSRTAYEQDSGGERYDAIIVRLAAAHLRDRLHFMDWLRGKLTVGGTVIVIDVEDGASGLESGALPLFGEMYRKSRLSLRPSRLLGLRDALVLEARRGGFAVKEERRYAAAADTPERRRLMHRYMQLVSGYHFGFPLPPDRERELERWYLDPVHTFQVGMFGLVLKTI